MSFRSFLRPFALLAPICLLACGGEAPEPKTADDDAVTLEEEDDSGVSVSSEIGGLNQEKVDEVFAETVSSLTKCLNQGSRRNEYLGGAVNFFIRIGSSGEIDHARMAESTLGDRDTEKCMLGALRKHHWPKPVGGEVGLASKSLDFDPPSDVRPPTEWSQSDVDETLSKMGDDVYGCKKGSRARITATMYVDTNGSVIGAGIASDDDSGESAADCLVDLLKRTTFPSPGSWPAKVSFRL
jgi:hypothetical protein